MEQKLPDYSKVDRFTGLIINNKYKILDKIASGGMSDVFLGIEIASGRKVAIKILHESYANKKGFIARFKREAQILFKLNHKNIVSIYDWGDFDNLYFIVMEYVKGQSLKEMIEKRGALPPKLAAKYALQICNALDAAHSNSLIHRDIKSQNIMITEEGQVKVADFGIAKSLADDITQTVTTFGSAHYMSPEQAQGKIMDWRTDIYSLGVVMFEMVTGDLPFRGGSSIDISIRHISEKPQMPSSIINTLPQDIEKIIIKCLEKNPENRYQNIHNLSGNLYDFLNNRPLRMETYTHAIKPDTSGILKRFFMGQTKSYNSPDFLIGKNKVSGNKINIALFITTIFFLVTFIFFLVLFINSNNKYNSFLNAQKIIKIPSVEGIDMQKARSILSTMGLALQSNGELFDNEIPSGTIIEQNPEAGDSLPAGSIISVKVSKGKEKEMLILPNFMGMNKEDVLKQLENLGIEAGQIKEEFNDFFTTGFVISQIPEAFSQIEYGTSIDLIISKGMQLITVPELAGLDYTHAVAALEALSLKVISKKETNLSLSPGTVLSVNPPAGSALNKNDTVYLLISVQEELLTVPEVTNLDLGTAQERLDTTGVQYEISFIAVDYSIQKNTVISQFPAGNDKILPQEKIIIFVGQ